MPIVRNLRTSNNVLQIIYLVTLLAIAFTVSMTIYLVVTDYTNRMMLAQEQTQNTASFYQDSTHLVLESIDSILTSLENILLLNPSPEILQDFLEETATPFPMIRALLVLNDDGTVIGDSRTSSSMVGFDLSDRQYFMVYQNKDKSGLYIGNPVQSRLNMEWVIPIAMGIYDATGHLQWVVLASVEPRYLATRLPYSEDRAGLSGYIVQADERILTNFPYNEQQINGEIAATLESDLPDILFNATDATGQYDSERYVVAYHLIEPYNIRVIFLQDKNNILQPFYRQSTITLFFMSLIIAGVVLTASRQITLTHEINRQAEARQQSESDYRRIVETAYEGICQIDADACIVFANQRIAEMLGYSIDDMLGKSVTLFLFEEDYANLMERLRSRQKGFSQQHEIRYKRQDGTALWTLISSSAIFDADEKYMGSFAMITDITKRKQSEQKLQAIFDATKDALLLINDEREFIDVNPAACELLGYTREEVLQLSIADITGSANRSKHLSHWAQFQQQKDWEGYYILRHKDGREIITEAQAVANILPGLHLSVVRDVTERQIMENDLRESESRFRTLAENTPMFIWVAENDQSISYVNRSWTDFTGRTRESELGKGWLDRLHPDDSFVLDEKYPTVHAAWRSFRIELRLRRFDDEYRWVLIQWAPRFDSPNVFVGYIGTGIDITQRKQVEDALRESELRFRKLADSTPLFIWLVEADKSLSYVNRAWLDFTGQTWEDAIGKGWLAVLHPDDVQWMSVAFSHEPEQQKAFENEARFRRHDGEYRWILMKGIPRYSPQGVFEGYVGSSVDITEQQQFAEQLSIQVQQATSELRESENRYRTLAEMSGAYSYSYLVFPDKSIQFEWITDGFTELSGYTIEDVTNPSLGVKYIFREDADKINAIREVLYEKPTQETVEYRMTTKTGETKFMLAHIKSEWDDNVQRVVRVVGTVHDISRQKAAENALRTERNFLHSVMNTTPNGVVVFDLNRNITLANERGRQILNLQGRVSPDNPKQFPLLEITDVNGTPIPLEQRPFAEVLKTQKPSYGHEQILVSLDGERTPIIVNAAPLLDEVGEIKQVVFVFEDISQLKQIEEALRAERNFLQSIMDATPSGIIVLDTEGLIRFANAQAEKILILNRDPITQQIQPIPDWQVLEMDGQTIPQEKRISSRIKRTLQPVFGAEQLLVRADGQQMPVRVNAVPQLDNDGNVQQIVYSFEDISLHLQSHRQIEQALKQEKEVNELKNRFVTLISHELRTPLSIIMTSAELLQRYHDKVTPEQILNRTDRIQKQVMRLKRIMEDVSFINKTDMVGHQIQLTVIDLLAFCETIIEGVLLIEENTPQIAIQHQGIVTNIVGDETLYYQILVNLVSNAVKYTPDTGNVTLTCTVTNETITLQVEDTGIGIPAEDQSKLFQSFHRAGNVSNIQGTGLGLDIIRRAVKALEGEISFKSKENEGTTFTVTLPNLAKKG